MPEGVKRVTIPFEEYSNLIVIPIVINGFFPLKFVLDTGAESVILTQKIYGDMLGLNYVRDITVHGAGIIDSLEAYVATNATMSLSGGIIGHGLNMLVLKEDYIRLSETLGEEVHGIIGYDVFSRFVVEIDYDDHLITLHRPATYRRSLFAEEVPLDVVNTKPYVTSVVLQNGKKDSLRLMVDSGASHALLLDVSSTDDIVLPEKLISTRIGQGLAGEIPGFLGRTSGFVLGKYCLDDILVSIPVAGAYASAIKRGSRHGTVGGDVLCRFEVTFDYMREKMYLRRGKEFGKAFEFDMSGMSIAVVGDQLDSMVIDRVRKNSPAYYVGLLPGDKVISVNRMNLANAKFSDISGLLRKKDGYKIRVVIERSGRRIVKIFRLEKVI